MRQVSVTIQVDVPETVADVVSQTRCDQQLHDKLLKMGTAHQIMRSAQMAHYQIQGKVRNGDGHGEY